MHVTEHRVRTICHKPSRRRRQ